MCTMLAGVQDHPTHSTTQQVAAKDGTDFEPYLRSEVAVRRGGAFTMAEQWPEQVGPDYIASRLSLVYSVNERQFATTVAYAPRVGENVIERQFPVPTMLGSARVHVDNVIRSGRLSDYQIIRLMFVDPMAEYKLDADERKAFETAYLDLHRIADWVPGEALVKHPSIVVTKEVGRQTTIGVFVPNREDTVVQGTVRYGGFYVFVFDKQAELIGMMQGHVWAPESVGVKSTQFDFDRFASAFMAAVNIKLVWMSDEFPKRPTTRPIMED
jgi:hypothetical protein